jgi:hypothetical protein
MDYVFDRVKLDLLVQQSVPSETVRVYVEAIVAATPEQASAAPELIRSTLAQVLPADWTTNFASRRDDNSGMEQIILQASTRVAEAKTAGLSDRLRKASRSGLSLKLRSIEFRPPQKQIDEIAKALRSKIYQLAQQEADTLNKALPSDTLPWRIGSITIISTVQKPEQALGRSSEYPGHGSMPRDLMGDTESENLVAGVRVALKGDVSLHRLSVLPPELKKTGSD